MCIPGYQTLFHSRTDSKGVGTGFLLKEGITYKCRKDLEIFDEKNTESLCVEINSKCGKKFVLGSLYRAPNTAPQVFIEHVHTTIDKVKSEKGEKQIILSMDHNLDLLKSHIHKGTQIFLDGILSRNVLLTITHPMQIIQTTATLIDNVFVSEYLQRAYDSAVIVSDMSDHLPLLGLLKQTKLLDKTPLVFESRNLN